MELSLDTLMLSVALAGTAAYTGYMIKKQRDEIRKTIQVIELGDTEFWQGLSELRDLVPARA
jgi:hypothetical protein